MLSNFEIAISVLSKIQNLGFEAYLIGGSVRDYILGYEVNDFDVTTNAPISKLSDNFNVIKSNEKFLNITIEYEGVEIEVTNFRRDIYSNNRFPNVKKVELILEDVLRRDFTINCIYMNSNKEIYFPLSSKCDIENKIITTVKDPNLSFQEDPLRMLRAITYAIKLNFKIEKQVLDAIDKNWHLIQTISKTRLNRQIEQVKKQNNYKNNEYFLKYLNI